MRRAGLVVPWLVYALIVSLWASVVPSPAAEPCRSGLEPGKRPGPYAAVVCTGSDRGTAHCYICDAGDRPIIIVFARNLSEPLGKLVQRLDRAVLQHKTADLRAWVTFLHEDQAALDAKIVQWGQQHAIRNVPLAVFEDVGGPPSYRLAAEADVTVLLSVRQRVVANFAYRTGELNDAAIAQLLKSVPRILDGAK